MDFTIEFYMTVSGRSPVEEFLEELKATDVDDFAAVLAGLAKLKNRRYHREPLSKSLGKGLTSQQHISRLESPGYEGHSLTNLRRVARALNARVRVVFEPDDEPRRPRASRAPVSNTKPPTTR